ncbi:hypothetical protein IFM47457_05434 [Aspergillus lentulus]|nr:hypothetical protein IFM47457_05434 [Aspergillus lentulus]
MCEVAIPGRYTGYACARSGVVVSNVNTKGCPGLNSVQSGPIPKPEEPVFGRVPDQGPAVNDGHDDNDDESGCNEYEATWPAGLMSQHNQPQAPVVAVYSQSNNPKSDDGWVLSLDYDGDEGDDLPYYYARVKPASEEQNEMSIDSPSTAPVSSAPSHPPTARFRDFIVKENLRKLTLKVAHARGVSPSWSS